MGPRERDRGRDLRHSHAGPPPLLLELLRGGIIILMPGCPGAARSPTFGGPRRLVSSATRGIIGCMHLYTHLHSPGDGTSGGVTPDAGPGGS